jgi:hypothetical protein
MISKNPQKEAHVRELLNTPKIVFGGANSKKLFSVQWLKF